MEVLILSLIVIIIVGIVLFIFTFLNKNQEIKEDLDRATELAKKIIDLIPDEKLKFGKIEISDIAKMVVTEIDDLLEADSKEERQALALKITQKVLDAIGHPQSIDEDFIKKAISTLIK